METSLKVYEVLSRSVTLAVTPVLAKSAKNNKPFKLLRISGKVSN